MPPVSFSSVAEMMAQVGEITWKSRDALIIGAINGVPPLFKAFGKFEDSLPIYGLGTGLGGLDGLYQLSRQLYAAYHISRYPDKGHVKPDYSRAVHGIMNMAGYALYGASSAGALPPDWAGAGLLVVGLGGFVKPYLPAQTDMYYPPLPMHALPSHGVHASHANQSPAGPPQPSPSSRPEGVDRDRYDMETGRRRDIPFDSYPNHPYRLAAAPEGEFAPRRGELGRSRRFSSEAARMRSDLGARLASASTDQPLPTPHRPPTVPAPAARRGPRLA